MTGPRISRARPSPDSIREFLAREGARSFSYPEVGATRKEPPAGYAVDHARVQLGSGAPVFEAACAALRRWEMFQLGWVEPCWPEAPIAEGSVVGVLARFSGLWFLNACRVIYRIEEAAPVRRFGFAYGTLPGHCERGEERFLIEWAGDDSVSYQILAFSRPSRPVYRLGYPLLRWLQWRFRRDSREAIVRAAARPPSLT